MRLAGCVVGVCVLFAGAAAAQEFVTLPGFSPDLDGVCGLGRDLQDGCDAIRAREIVDASSESWRSVGRVNFANVEMRRHCTGTLVAPDIVLTAAHCLRLEDGSVVPLSAVTFVAGYQRGESVAVARAKAVVLGDHDARSPALDWALVRLETSLAHQVDILPLAAPDYGAAVLLGYAGLRAHVLSRAACDSLGSVRSGLYVLTCPLMPGDSGAPVVVTQGGELRVAAVMSSIVRSDGGLRALAIPAGTFEAALAEMANP